MPSDSPAAAPALSPAPTRADVSDPAPTTPAAAHNPLCPRCGYDLRGQAPATPAADPTATGTCAECGLTFPWREVLDPDLASPRWFIESRAGSWRLIRTFFRTLIPPRFWGEPRGVRLTTPGRPWPRIRFLLVTLLLTLLLSWAAPVALAAAFWLAGGPTPAVGPGAGFAGYEPPPFREDHILWPLGDTFGPPVAAIVRDWFARANAGIWMGETSFHDIRGFTYLFWLGALWAALTPAGLLVLQTTRRVCRITGVHIMRAAIYSTSAVSLLCGLTFGMIFAGFVISWNTPWQSPSSVSRWLIWAFGLIEEYCVFIVPLLGLWLFWWWRTAIHRYMKMPSATGITAAILIMGFLAAAIIVTTVAAPGPMQEIGTRLEDWFR